VAERLFISQTKLEGWIEGAKVTFQDNLLTLLAEKVAYRVEPAARILRLLDGEDRAGLVGKSVTVAELTAQKAEHFQDSVILGDAAYECEQGFMGTAEPPLVLAPVTTAGAARPPPPASPSTSRPPALVAVRAPVPPLPATARPTTLPRPAVPPSVVARPPASPPARADVAAKPEGAADNSADLLAEFMLKHL
jgi:hypothetical protein